MELGQKTCENSHQCEIANKAYYSMINFLRLVSFAPPDQMSVMVVSVWVREYKHDSSGPG